MISGLAFINTAHITKAQASTPVNGIIGSDTTWTQTNSPYSLTGNVLVNNGVTLTLQSGTILDLNSYYIRVNGSLIIQSGATINMDLLGSDSIQVNGVLYAVGTSANPIHINGNYEFYDSLGPAIYSTITFSQFSMGWNQQTNSGSLIENTIINSTEIEVSSGVKISDNTFLSSSLTLLGGSPTVLNNNLASGLSLIDGLSLGKASENLSPVISNNKINGLNIGAGSGVVSDNVISSLTISDAYGSPVSTLIERNMISDSSVGISCNIQNSYNGKATITNNTITNNAVGIQVGSPYAPTIVENNIYGNQINAKLSGTASGEVNLINNWWETTDSQAINQTIYDFKDDFNLGTVNFVPFLTAPNSQATPNPNAPISTPNASPASSPTIPEFQSAIALTIALLATTSVILACKKKKSLVLEGRK